MMKALIEGFPEQLRIALQIAADAKLSPATTSFSNVVIAGMGGSGIGGSLIRSLASEDLRLPVDVSKSYDIPG